MFSLVEVVIDVTKTCATYIIKKLAVPFLISLTTIVLFIAWSSNDDIKEVLHNQTKDGVNTTGAIRAHFYSKFLNLTVETQIIKEKVDEHIDELKEHTVELKELVDRGQHDIDEDSESTEETEVSTLKEIEKISSEIEELRKDFTGLNDLITTTLKNLAAE